MATPRRKGVADGWTGSTPRRSIESPIVREDGNGRDFDRDGVSRCSASFEYYVKTLTSHGDLHQVVQTLRELGYMGVVPGRVLYLDVLEVARRRRVSLTTMNALLYVMLWIERKMPPALYPIQWRDYASHQRHRLTVFRHGENGAKARGGTRVETPGRLHVERILSLVMGVLQDLVGEMPLVERAVEEPSFALFESVLDMGDDDDDLHPDPSPKKKVAKVDDDEEEDDDDEDDEDEDDEVATYMTGKERLKSSRSTKVDPPPRKKRRAAVEIADAAEQAEKGASQAPSADHRTLPPDREAGHWLLLSYLADSFDLDLRVHLKWSTVRESLAHSVFMSSRRSMRDLLAVLMRLFHMAPPSRVVLLVRWIGLALSVVPSPTASLGDLDVGSVVYVEWKSLRNDLFSHFLTLRPSRRRLFLQALDHIPVKVELLDLLLTCLCAGSLGGSATLGLRECSLSCRKFVKYTLTLRPIKERVVDPGDMALYLFYVNHLATAAFSQGYLTDDPNDMQAGKAMTVSQVAEAVGIFVEDIRAFMSQFTPRLLAKKETKTHLDLLRAMSVNRMFAPVDGRMRVRFTDPTFFLAMRAPLPLLSFPAEESEGECDNDVEQSGETVIVGQLREAKEEDMSSHSVVELSSSPYDISSAVSSLILSTSDLSPPQGRGVRHAARMAALEISSDEK